MHLCGMAINKQTYANEKNFIKFKKHQVLLRVKRKLHEI